MLALVVHVPPSTMAEVVWRLQAVSLGVGPATQVMVVVGLPRHRQLVSHLALVVAVAAAEEA